MNSDPLFLRFVNRELGVSDLLNLFSRSADSFTAETALKALDTPPDLLEFHRELTDAVNDVVKEGIGHEFRAFVNHYLGTLVEDVDMSPSAYGENVSRVARIKDPSGPWVAGMVCYNLCLYLKAYGLENLKKCKVCGKLFAHKGKYAVYCSDQCKAGAKGRQNFQERDEKSTKIDPFRPF